jgi:hypothetical protein
MRRCLAGARHGVKSLSECHGASCLCSEGRASHTVVNIRAPLDRAASALHEGRVGGQDGGGQAVAEAHMTTILHIM